MHRATLAALCLPVALSLACVRREVVYVCPAPQPGVRADANVQVTVRVNCEAICRQSYNACQRGCTPQAWSPEMQGIRDHCERGCDFDRFSCVSSCQHNL